MDASKLSLRLNFEKIGQEGVKKQCPIDQDQLDIIADKLNNRPRKILNFLSPLEYTSKYNTMQKNLNLSHLRV